MRFVRARTPRGRTWGIPTQPWWLAVALRGPQRARLIRAGQKRLVQSPWSSQFDDEEAIEAMNDTSYGLTASVYTWTVPRPSPYSAARTSARVPESQRSVAALDW